MGSIGGMFGLSGGASGTGFAGPAGSIITPGTTEGQIGTAYTGAQNSLESQKALLAALQAQNGIGNQSQVYGQLQGVVNGTGPNPAQAMLSRATNQNVQNQAALMAGQRGASANTGLIARQAAQQGAGIQQDAASQAAALQAQQSLNALGAAGNIAGGQVANQMAATTANTQAQQNEQQILQNALAAQNNANVQSQANVNNVNGQLANTGMQGQQKVIGGLMNSGAMALMGAEGGTVQKFGFGGSPMLQAPQIETPMPGPQSSFGAFLAGWPNQMSAPGTADINGPTYGPGTNEGQIDFKKSPKSPGSFAASAPQEGDMSSMQQNLMGIQGGGATGGMEFNQGGNVGSKLKEGGHVPGKASVAGNSYSNDTVKALLSPGELVVDRDTMADKGAAGQAARFLAAVINAKKGKK